MQRLRVVTTPRDPLGDPVYSHRLTASKADAENEVGITILKKTQKPNPKPHVNVMKKYVNVLLKLM